MKIQKVYDPNSWIVLDNARFETYNDVSVVIGIVVDCSYPSDAFVIGEEACLLESDLVKVIRE